MTRSLLRHALLATLVLALAPAVVRAGSDALERILVSLNADLDEITADVNQDMDRVVDRCVTLLANLDRTGASERKLTKTARAYKRQLTPIANSIFPQFNRLEGDYVRRCIRENAGAGATGVVSDVIDEEIEQVRADLFDARAAIDDALAAEIAD